MTKEKAIYLGNVGDTFLVHSRKGENAQQIRLKGKRATFNYNHACIVIASKTSKVYMMVNTPSMLKLTETLFVRDKRLCIPFADCNSVPNDLGLRGKWRSMMIASQSQ